MRITSRKVARAVADEYGMSPCLVQELVVAFIYGCAKVLSDGDELVIEGLGILQAKKEKQTSTVTARDGKKYIRHARVRVSFRRSPALGRMLRRRMLTKKERGVT